MPILQGHNRKNTVGEYGFTLIEILIAMTIGLVLMGSVYAFHISQQKAMFRQEQIIEMDQNLQFAVDSIARDLKNAGYDPTGAFIPGRTSGFVSDNTVTPSFNITNVQIRILSDLIDNADIDGDGDFNDGDGDVDDDGERVTYSLLNREIIRSAWDSTTNTMIPELLSENIATLGFNYLDSANIVIPSDPKVANTDLSNIRLVQVFVTATTSREDPDFFGGVDLNGNVADGTARSRTITTMVETQNIGMR